MILVVDGDPSWPRRFAALRDEYDAALSRADVPVVAIEHVGSTAVPGLAAKPIIDCDIVVTVDRVGAASNVLASLGFQPEGELGISQRWAFKEPARLHGTHTYVIVEGSLAVRNHLGLRDALRADTVLRDLYGAEKKKVAASARSIEEYGDGKSAVIQQILVAAGLTDRERRVIDAAQTSARICVPHTRALERDNDPCATAPAHGRRAAARP